MPNKFDFLKFDALPAAEVFDEGDNIRLKAPRISGVDEGQEIVFFLRNHQGDGIAVYVKLTKKTLNDAIEVVLQKDKLPKAKSLTIDYGAYINESSVHRSAVSHYPPLEDQA
ncbi:hypothetical protein ACEK06_15430 [Pseudomonas brenneri]|uniref:hypothetical protein n=1 Tax=Pseudomonas brenneri TaxID=129817 RepID=UPI003570C253